MTLRFSRLAGDAKISFTEKDKGKRPIDLLAKGTPRHDAIRDYLLERLSASERAMSRRYTRWRLNEHQFQAYINLQEHEKVLKQSTALKGMPEITSLVIPYSYSTIMSIVTYLLQTFAGKEPIFAIDASRADAMNAQPYMELALKHNTSHVRMVLKIFQFLLDGQVYNLSVMRNLWTVEERMTTVYRQAPMMGPLGTMPNFAGPRQRVREKRVTFEGTSTTNVDPFMFFPDPRVPLTEVSRKGEFVFWRDFQGLHSLEEQEAMGFIAHLDDIGDRPKNTNYSFGDVPSSNRNAGRSEDGGHSSQFRADNNLEDYVQLDQGTVVITPNRLGLGDGTEPEKWLFTIANKRQIIQAEPLDLDHGMHPVVVSEPYSMGYSPGGMSMVEMLEPLQEGMSWLLNSHIHNVRGIINNSFVVDPSAIDMTSFKDGKPGKLIKLKPSAIGRDIKTVVQQLQVVDATQAHINDIEVLRRLGDAVSAINDNMRGLQAAGGRKTATEIRTSTESGASRLVTLARVISSQAMVDQAEQMVINMQQLTTEAFMAKVVGDDGLERILAITPENLIGDFNFPVHDGTLPLDKVAILDVWKEIFMAVAKIPMLQQEYNIGAIFDFVAELSGARNLSKFRNNPAAMQMQMAPPEVMQRQAEQGNVVPLFGSGGPGPNGGRGIPDFSGAAG